MRRSAKGEMPADRPLQEHLDEALAQQAATAEILELISSSPTDLQRVLEAILACATRLCEAHLGVLQLREGDSYRAVAEQGATAEFKAWLFEGPRRLDPATGVGRALLEGQAVHIADITDGPACRATGIRPASPPWSSAGREPSWPCPCSARGRPSALS